MTKNITEFPVIEKQPPETFLASPELSTPTADQDDKPTNKIQASSNGLLTTNHQAETNDTAVAEIPSPLLFDAYFNERKNFVVEYSYRARSLLQILENYFSDKSFQGKPVFNILIITVVSLVVCTLGVALIIMLRLENLRKCLILLWSPVVVLAIFLGYNCALLIGFGTIVNTACIKLDSINHGF